MSGPTACVSAAGVITGQVRSCNELIWSEHLYVAATGISDDPLLAGVRYRGDCAEAQSLVLPHDTGTRRMIQTEHTRDNPIDKRHAGG